MKNNELMIGDWVYVAHQHSNIGGDYDLEFIPEKLTLEHFKFWAENEWNNTDFNEFLKPIPITEEILEKNEYYYNEIEDIWQLIPDNGFGICKDEKDNCFYFCLGLFDAFNSYSNTTYYYITKIEYVHELQHTLRLCKIEKEIKIN